MSKTVEKPQAFVSEKETEYFSNIEMLGNRAIVKAFPAIKIVNGVERVSKDDVVPKGEVVSSSIEGVSVGDVVGFSFGMITTMNHLMVSELESESSKGRYLWLGENNVLYKNKKK